MKTDRFLIPAIILSITAFAPILDARTWTEASTGRTVDGEFVELDGTQVVIKRPGGQTIKISVSRLSEADNAFIKAQSPAKPAAAAAPTAAPAGSGDGGPLTKLTPPASAEGLPITGKAKDRKSGIKVTNNGDRAITEMGVRMFFLKADGSVGKSVPHTQSGFFGQPGDVLRKGKSHTIDVTSFFMEDDTTGVGGMVTEITYDDDSTWPPPPAKPPARNGGDPVSAVMIGVLGEGDKAEPVVACHNYGAKAVKSVNYQIEYLGVDGKVIDKTNYGYAGGDDPILPSGKSLVLTGGDGPPKGAVDAKVSVTSLTHADDAE